MNKTEKKSEEKLKPIIFWNGFPACGLLLKQVAYNYGEDLIVVATKPTVPFTGLEALFGHKIIWLDNANDIWERKAEFSDRNFVIHTGWVYNGWLAYDKYIKKQNNAKIILAVDNRYRGDLRQYIGAVWFRLRIKKYIDAVLVPGVEGIRLMKFLGMNPHRIYTGLYGAYEGIFHETKPIQERNKEFLFVGQLNKRKSVDVLIAAFTHYRKTGGTWDLRIIGDGPLETICRGDGITRESFTQPYNIALQMNNARVLVLPSRDDNWGTVVCEAAACGMLLITTKNVGASADIIKEKENGIVLDNIHTTDLEHAFFYYEQLSDDSLLEGSRISKKIANDYTSTRYYTTFLKIVKDLTG